MERVYRVTANLTRQEYELLREYKRRVGASSLSEALRLALREAARCGN